MENKQLKKESKHIEERIPAGRRECMRNEAKKQQERLEKAAVLIAKEKKIMFGWTNPALQSMTLATVLRLEPRFTAM